MSCPDLFTLIVDESDSAIDFCVEALGPRTEDYGRIAVFLDIAGNRWDLLGPG